MLWYISKLVEMDKTARRVFVQFVWSSMPLDTDARRCIVSARRGSHISCCARRIGAIRIARRPSSRACGRTPGGARRSQGGAGRPGSPGGRSRRSALVRNGDRLTHVGKTASGPTARPAIARQWRSGMSGGLLGASKSDRSRTCASVRAPPSQLARLWASGVSDGIRPSGGSTIFEVRAPTRFTDKNTEL